MSIEEFKSELLKSFNEKCKISNIPAKMTIMPVWKVNTHEDKIVITMIGKDGATPMISLQDVYQDYCRNKCDLDKTVLAVLNTYIYYCNNEDYQTLSKRDIIDYKLYENLVKVPGRLLPVLINTKANKEFLTGLVYKPWLDLSIIYKLTIDNNKNTSMSLYLTKALIKYFALTEDELHEIAYHNLEKVTALACTDKLPSKYNDKKDNIMIAITTNVEDFGASAILDQNVLQYLAKEYGDMYLVPASTDIFYAIKTDMTTKEDLLEDIYEINQTIPPTERLSNNAYLFHASGLRIELIRSLHKDLL